MFFTPSQSYVSFAHTIQIQWQIERYVAGGRNLRAIKGQEILDAGARERLGSYARVGCTKSIRAIWHLSWDPCLNPQPGCEFGHLQLWPSLLQLRHHEWSKAIRVHGTQRRQCGWAADHRVSLLERLNSQKRRWLYEALYSSTVWVGTHQRPGHTSLLEIFYDQRVKRESSGREIFFQTKSPMLGFWPMDTTLILRISTFSTRSMKSAYTVIQQTS